VRPTEGVIIKMLKQLKITPEEVRQHARRAIQDATNAATRMTTTLTRESIRVDMTPDSAPAEQPRLRVVFSDRARNEVKVEMSLTVEQAKEAMIVFAKALSRNQKGKVLDLDQDAQTHIDVFIE
jgi:CheY-specific phosphatase CheX